MCIMFPVRLRSFVWKRLFLLATFVWIKADIVRDFTNLTTQLNHLAVDRNTGEVYVGAVNRIFKVSTNLDITQSISTGPVTESSFCYDCPDKNRARDNVNKVLLIAYDKNKLITCDSAKDGLCTLRSLYDISENVQSDEPVVADDATSTTVAFIGPGPHGPNTEVMYIGATYATNFGNPDIPAVSSRSLQNANLFRLAHSAVTTGTRMYVNSLARNRYRINYIYGFSSEGFSYFLTTQPRGIGSDIHYSKLVRVCHEDFDYYSYTEVPILCKDDETDYNLVQAGFVGKAGSTFAVELGITEQEDVLYAVFSRSQSEGMTNAPSDRSALCVYSLKSIRRKFMQNIKMCFSGIGSRGLDFISPSHTCIPVKLNSVNENYCGSNVNTPLGGELAIQATPVASYDKKFTAIAATVVEDNTVVFAGTHSGDLVKAVVDNSTSSFIFEDSAIDAGSAVNKDLCFDAEHSHLYVMTERKLTKVKVEDCHVHKSCISCTFDPYCGWCLLENKCSQRSDCEDAAKSSSHWISFRSHGCYNLTVRPDVLNIKKTQTLFLENLPSIDETLLCAFDIFDNTLFTTVSNRYTAENISYAVCNSPRVNSLPPIPEGQNHYTIKMSVRTDRSFDFPAKNLTIFNCDTYKSCMQCVGSQFSCDWNFKSHSCISDYEEVSQNSHIVIGKNSKRADNDNSKWLVGLDSCPTVNSALDGTNEMFVPIGLKTEVQVKLAFNSSTALGDICRLQCQYRINYKRITTEASYDNSTLYCKPAALWGHNGSRNIKIRKDAVNFNVLCNGGALDNPNNVHVIVYNCRFMAESCGDCLMLPGNLGCGWCDIANGCEAFLGCFYTKDYDPKKLLNYTQVCPNPEITSFYPLLGAWDGKTQITVKGFDLGRVASDIGSVTVAGIPCHPIKELYVPPKQIVCRTYGPAESAPLSGPVIVTILSVLHNYTGISKDNYSFVHPIIDKIHPSRGPKSGGTVITIKGKLLNAGNNVSIHIADKQIKTPCIIQDVTSTKVTCKTAAVKVPHHGKIQMFFDNALRVQQQYTFYYLNDPVVYSVNRNRGIRSGGLNIQVTGQYFHAIQAPKIYVVFEGKMYFGLCIHVDYQTKLMCKSPVIEDGIPTVDMEHPLQYTFGFIMDDVDDVKDLSKKSKGYFNLYPNPSFNKVNKFVDLESRVLHLTVNGDNLSEAVYSSEDIEILVGNNKCEVVSIKEYQLGCYMSLDEFRSKDEVNVNVRIGNLDFDLGKLTLRKSVTASCMCWSDSGDRVFGSLTLLDHSNFNFKDNILARWNYKVNVDNFVIEQNTLS